jgi:hypothetical protein
MLVKQLETQGVEVPSNIRFVCVCVDSVSVSIYYLYLYLSIYLYVCL